MHSAIAQSGGDTTAASINTIKNCAILVNSYGGFAGGQSTTSSDAVTLFENCDITYSVVAESIGYPTKNRAQLIVRGGSLTFDSPVEGFLTVKEGTAEGTTLIEDVDINCIAAKDYFFSNDATGGNTKLLNNRITLSGTSTAKLLNLASTASLTSTGNEFTYNGINSTSTVARTLIDSPLAGVGVLMAHSNTIHDGNATPVVTAFDFHSSTLAHEIKRTIFSNVADAIANNGDNVVLDYNNYFGCADEGGTNSSVVNPGFINTSLGDISLDGTSSVSADCNMWWTSTGRRPIGADGEPFSDYETSRGAYQSKNTPSHPLV